MVQKITSSNTYSFGKPFFKENNVRQSCVKYCATVSNIVSLCEVLCYCVKYCVPLWNMCPCVKYCATLSNIAPVWNIVPLCQIFCTYMKYCVPVSNIMPLCQILCIYVKYCATVSNVVPLCQLLCPCVKYYATVSNILSLCQILCHCIKHVSSPSSSSLPRAVQRRERVADAKVPASNKTLILENFTWAEKYFTKMSFLTFVKNSTPVADVPVINRTC